MADTKISAMPNATPLTGTEYIPIVQGGANAKTTPTAINTFLESKYLNAGAWSSTDTQTGSTTSGTALTFNSTDYNSGVTLVSGSQMTVAVSGTYNLQWSAQFENTDVSPVDCYVWLRVNGVDVPGSSGKIGMPARKTPSNPFHSLIGWNFFLTLTAGQNVQLIWLPTSLSVTIPFYPAQVVPVIPSTASVVATMNQVG